MPFLDKDGCARLWKNTVNKIRSEVNTAFEDVPEVYVQNDEPLGVGDGALWLDMDGTMVDVDKDTVIFPSTAEVGQLLSVETVDASGKPTGWKAVDAPSGENNNDWELINTVTFTEEGITSFLINKDQNGNPFELSDVWLVSNYAKSLGGTAASSARVKVVMNGKDVHFHIGNISAAQRNFVLVATLINNRIYWGHTDFANATDENVGVNIRPMQNISNDSPYNDNSITSVGIRIDNAGTEYFAVGYKMTLWGRRK